MRMPAVLGLVSVVGAAVAVETVPADAQMTEFLGEHMLETLPFEIPGTGRIGGVTVDGWGYMYVANQDENVWRIAPSGRVETWLGGLYGSASGVVLRSGELIHTEWAGSKIWKVARGGEAELLAGEGLEGPVGIVAVGEWLYTVNANSNWVARVSLDGEVEEFVRDDRLQIPNGIAADPDGNLYVVSLGNTVVLKIAPSGGISEVATLPGTANAHVAFAAGFLYVTQIWEHVVLRVAMDGSYTVVAGDGTRHDLPFPNGIAATRSGDAVYFNTLEGNMINGHEGVIRIHKLSLPTPNRAFETAWSAGGADGLRAKFEQGLSLDEVPRAQILPAYYGIGRYLAGIGEEEAGIALTDWTAEIDEDELRASRSRGRAHMLYGDRDVAITSLARAVELAPDDAELARLLEGARSYRKR